MTDILCELSHSDIFDLIKKEKNILNYFNIIRERINNNLFKKIVTDKNLLKSCDDVYKILKEYIEVYNKKYNFYLVKCEIDILFDNDDNIHKLESTFEYNSEIYKIDIQLKFFIEMMKEEHNMIFKKINQMTIIIIKDICNMTDNYSKYMRCSSIERKINQLPCKNKLLNQTSNNILIKNKSHILFNI